MTIRGNATLAKPFGVYDLLKATRGMFRRRAGRDTGPDMATRSFARTLPPALAAMPVTSCESPDVIQGETGIVEPAI